ncbi:MAG: sel1 repeat family protein [Candidatus Riflebacteria bacterium]|nr:sel1 repeat family protein [Candidatus Riflebacteria bacterium]
MRKFLRISFHRFIILVIITSCISFAHAGLPSAANALRSGDYPAALRELRYWALKGDSTSHRAQCALGDLYLEGKGIEKNHSEALKWYSMAAEQGNPRANSMIGIIFAEGLGVPKDLVQAEFFWLKAAEYGETSAQINLAVLYINNPVSEEKTVEALKWLIVASRDGADEKLVNQAFKIQEKIRIQLSEDKVEKAKNLAKKFKRKK